MNPNPSLITEERVSRALMQRYSPFPELSMTLLSQQLNSARIGDLRPLARTFEIMLERDGELAGPYQKRCESLGGRAWEIHTMEESAEAEAHAEALRYFYDHCIATSVLDLDETGDVSLLLEHVASAIGHRYSVSEMLLRVDDAGKKQVTAEFRHCPVWFFEARSGRLRFLEEEYASEGVPMEPERWLVAVGQGLLRPCAVAYGTKHFPLADWMLYASRFGLPGIHGETDAHKDSQEWNDFAAALQAFANDWITLTSTGAKINLIEAKATGEGPFKELVERSDRLFSKLFRGSDLATSSRGKDAVGASVQTGESAVLDVRDARWATGIFNARIDRPVIRYLFNAEPKAWFRISTEEKPNLELDLKTGDWLVRNNAPISVRTARERFGWPEPEPGEPCLAAPPPVMPVGLGAGPGGRGAGGADDAMPDPAKPELALENAQADPTDPIVKARAAALAQAYRGSMAPFRQAILLSNSREEALARITALYADWPAARLAEELENALQIAAAAGSARMG